jgi:hypothetical protein
MEHLFVEAVASSMADPVILKRDNLAAPERPATRDRARAMAEALESITHPGAPPIDGFRTMIKSAIDSAAIGRRQIARRHVLALERTLAGANSHERAALLLSFVAGVHLMRQTLRLPALTAARPATLIALMTPLFEQLLAPDFRH